MPRGYNKNHYLTEEQKELASSAYYLAWSYIDQLLDRKMIQRHEIDDVAGHVMWKLCMAAESYNKDDASGAKFSTYAWRAFITGYLRYLALGKNFNGRFVTIDFKNFSDDNVKGIDPPWEYVPEMVVKWEDLESLMKNAYLSEIEKDILTSYYKCGIIFREIGERLGYTRERIRQIHWQAIKKNEKSCKR